MPKITRVASQVGAQPRGHYTAAEVGQLAGVSGKKIGQWARRGYIRASWSDVPPLEYSYQDVAEAMVVHDLERRGIQPAAIGQAVDELRRLFGTQWPLQIAELYGPSRRGRRGSKAVVAQIGGEKRDVVSKHPVLGRLDLIQIVLDLQRGGWAVRDLPRLQHIEVDPDRLSGQPTIRGRRVSARTVALMARTPEGVDELKDGYDLSSAEIRDASRWWDQVSHYEAAA